MGMKTIRTLVAEDNTEDYETIRGYLESPFLEDARLAVERAADGKEALSRMRSRAYGLVILDVCLPRMDGREVLKGVRARKPLLPIVATSSFEGDFGEAETLNAGADDFISKPFSKVTFLARVKAAIRHGRLAGAEKVASWGRLTLDVGTQRASYARKPLSLSGKEFCILKALVDAQGRTIDADAIEKAAWGGVDRTSTRLESKIKVLRDKLCALGAPRDVIDSNRGMGYVLRDR